MPKTTEGVVLVGHSLGGLTIPVVAARTKTLMTVYLCALVPMPGLSFDAQAADLSTGFEPSEAAISHPDGSASWPERGAIESFFHDCDPEIARAAARRLRKQHWLVTREVTPLRRWPDSPAAYILCTDDRVVSPAYSRRAARDQLGVEPIEIAGGHSPFLSRPRELATVLERLVE
jgi:pimeloyl-ACP methyl ester carboxylesterase